MFSACIDKKGKDVRYVRLFCGQIMRFNFFNFNIIPVIDKCYLWSLENPEIGNEHKRYCQVVPINRVKDLTIETEYCGFDICATQLSFICKTTEFGEEYQGNYSVTKSGYPCDSWINHKEEILDYPWLVYDKNYCRNPRKDSNGPWCFIVHSKQKTWDYCQVPECMNIAPYGTVKMDYVKKPENLYCLTSNNGKEYEGYMNESLSGPCLYWNDVKEWDYKIPPNHNFCRNPNKRKKPWCYIHSLKENWNYCNIPMCNNFDPGDLFSAIKAIDRNREQSYQSCAVTESSKFTNISYVTWQWKAPEVVKIVGIRVYPALTYLEDFSHIKIILYNPELHENVICHLQYRDGQIPFIDYPCIQQTDRISIVLDIIDISLTLALCEVEIYISSETRDCFNFLGGIDFMGTRSIAANGKICSLWEGHAVINQYFFPEGKGSNKNVVNKIKNYCRNPTLKQSKLMSGPFCYTENTIEICDVSKCRDDTFSIVMTKPSNARLNKSFLLICTASSVSFKPILIVWMRGKNIPIENNQNFGITQLNGSTSELHIRSLGSTLSTIICQATIGSHFASSTYTYTALPECNTCWNEIRKLCSIICGFYNPPVTLPLSKNCKMTCVLETVNATVQCIEIDGSLVWKPVDICVYKPIITENMINKDDQKDHGSYDLQPLKLKALSLPDFLNFFFILMFIFIFGMFLIAIFSESLRVLCF